MPKPISEWCYSKEVLLKKEETKQHKLSCKRDVGVAQALKDQKKISFSYILLSLAIFKDKIIEIINKFYS